MDNEDYKVAELRRKTEQQIAAGDFNARVALAASQGGLREDTIGEFAVEQQARGTLSDEQLNASLTELNGAVSDTVKGVAVGPFAAAPDIVGMAWNAMPSYYAGPGMNQVKAAIPFDIPESVTTFSGDPLRDLVNLDPQSGYGILGEALGGWEAVAAKAPAATKALLTALYNTDPYGMTKAMFIGAIGGERLAASGIAYSPRVAKLDEFLAKGDVAPFDADGFVETGWFNGADGLPRFHLSDEGARVNLDYFKNHEVADRMKQAWTKTGKKQADVISFRLGDVLVDHDQLYAAYPELLDLRVTAHVEIQQGGNGGLWFRDRKNPNSMGATLRGRSDEGEPLVRQLITNNARHIDDYLETLLHEVGHTIQEVEGHATGASNAVDWAALHRLQASVAAKQAFDLIDGGIVNVDDAYLFLVADGVPANHARTVVSDKMFSYYAGADDAGRNELRTAFAGAGADAENEIGFVLNYLFGSEDRVPQGNALFNTVIANMSPKEKQRLLYESYQNSYGELEVRLTEHLREMSQEAIDSQPMPFNPVKDAPRTYPTRAPNTEPSIIQGPRRRVAEFDSPESLPEGGRVSSERDASDPLANWHNTQDSGRGGNNVGPANDVPNESNLTGASELPEGTNRIEDLSDPDTMPQDELAVMSQSEAKILEQPSFDDLNKLADEIGHDDFAYAYNPEEKTLQIWDSKTGPDPMTMEMTGGSEYGLAGYDELVDYIDEINAAPSRYEPPPITAQEQREYAQDLARRQVGNAEAVARNLPDTINDVYITNPFHGAKKGKVRVEVLKNPSERAFLKWANKHFQGRDPEDRGLRILTDVDGNFILWEANAALHDDVIKATGINIRYEDDWTDVDEVPMNEVFDLLRKTGTIKGG